MIRVLDFGKFSALGIYVFLEDLTIVCFPLFLVLVLDMC